MKANDTRIRILLEGAKEFMVPLFQRTYSWKRKNIERFWEDVQSAKEDRKIDQDGTHFFGSFVTMPIPSSASGVSRYVIIDGQQRLVTTLVFLAALRNRINELKPTYDKKDEINEMYLVNKFHEDHRHKVVPTQADRALFFQILDQPDAPTDSSHPIAGAYRLFHRNLSDVGSLEALVAQKDAILSGFSVVDIRLESSDDPYLIFESLNATGTALTQADLIRNYLFMRIGQDRQQGVYDAVWFPMQENLKDRLEEFIRHYLAMHGDIPTFSKIYVTFKDTTDERAKDEDAVIQSMDELRKFGDYYHRFLYPDNEQNLELRERFRAFTRLATTTPYPLMLRLYDEYVCRSITLDELSACLKAIETYVVRRAVCRIPAQALNRFFPALVKSVDYGHLVDSLRYTLASATGSRAMPDDDQFQRCLTRGAILDRRTVRYLLEEIERWNSKEVVDFESLQVEHIMPQQLTDDWKKALGSEWELVHRSYLNTLGNLTLTGYNPEYSNKPFTEKRDMDKGFRESGLRLNRAIAGLDGWGDEEITARASELSGVAMQIWSFQI